MTQYRCEAPTSGQVGPKLQGLGKALPNKQFFTFWPQGENVKMCKCQYTCPACRLAEMQKWLLFLF